jgi:hypothetical protein
LPNTKTVLLLDQSFYQRFKLLESPKIWQTVVRFATSFVNAFNSTNLSSKVVAATPCGSNSKQLNVETLPIDCFGHNFMDQRMMTSIWIWTTPRIKIIILTDAPNATDDAIKWLRAQKIELFIIAVGDISEVEWLKKVVATPWESHFMHVGDYGQLDILLPALIGVVCNQSTTSVADSRVRSGQHFCLRLITDFTTAICRLSVVWPNSMA